MQILSKKENKPEQLLFSKAARPQRTTSATREDDVLSWRRGVGNQAVQRMLATTARHRPGSLRHGDVIGKEAADAIRASRPSGPLPSGVREDMAAASGRDFDAISIHNDASAHRAADHLQARAFTLGNNIYFAHGQYQPATTAGRHLLAHEAAHTVQQHGVYAQPDEHFQVSGSGDREELEAGRFADFVVGPRTTAATALTPSTRAGMIHRAVSFTHEHDIVNTNPVVPLELDDGFVLAATRHPAVEWSTDVTIHGAAGDHFGNFQVGFRQVVTESISNARYFTPVPGNRADLLRNPLPLRDAITQSDIFAVPDGHSGVRPAFVADGDVRSPKHVDFPISVMYPWVPPKMLLAPHNPFAHDLPTWGKVDYRLSLVTFLSVHDRSKGTGAASFLDLANVHCSLAATGIFDTLRPVETRVSLLSHATSTGVMEGDFGGVRPIVGGPIANDSYVTVDT